MKRTVTFAGHDEPHPHQRDELRVHLFVPDRDRGVGHRGDDHADKRRAFLERRSRNGIEHVRPWPPARKPCERRRSGRQLGNGGRLGGRHCGEVLLTGVQIDFSGTKTIDHVVVYSVQDNTAAPTTPTDTMTFTKYGVSSFTVQAWNGTAWTTLATVTGNNLVKRTVTFAATATSRMRFDVGSSPYVYSRLTEIEAWAIEHAARYPHLASRAKAVSSPRNVGDVADQAEARVVTR